MSTEIKKKRPPKLKSVVSDASPNNEGTSLSSATSNQTNLDSKVEISVGDQTNILVSPDSLVVMQQLGRGQYGIVERVCHQASGCQFAVKRVPLKPGDDNERQRFLMDVDILVKGTKCQNIIKFYGALIWEGDLWILMELMDCSLDKFYKLAHRDVSSPKVIDTSRMQLTSSFQCNHLGPDIELGECEICNPIREKVLGRMAGDIVNALSYLYSIKVIHRDIKPSNILINREGVIKLCDFGISGYLVNSVARTYEAGCRPYMAPERIDPPKGRTGYDIKSDVWSFGITMLEIATGRYPYLHARDFFEQLKRICTDEPPKLPQGRFSPNFESFISQCLRKDYLTRPKYDALKIHPFIDANKAVDISSYTRKIIIDNLDER